ncbi:hypothetical protein VTN77DRAFT_3643 [Rasamsonia byssochlamydoides]|uniref:uncharacterized protein n=1 Tax=Rasamsonia byssochlamydoides TaxID=89139 RepID=UPI003742A4A0
MKAALILELSCLAALATARPVQLPDTGKLFAPREVPQEHSHEKFLTSVRNSLNLNNPAKIVDPVFALLGNAAAAAGAGSITDLDCLQQAVADQAFTNAKAQGDVQGMTAALIFRTLERNTGAVGTKSALCTSLQAVNPEIAALQQHQDPASEGAAENNKQVALNLAVQIAKIGGNPQDAIQSGTFAPGQIGDPTAKGNSCDDANDPEGCIFTQNLLVPDVTADEINAAVAAAGISVSSAAATAAATATATATATAAAAATPTETAAAASAAAGTCSSGSSTSSSSSATSSSSTTTTTTNTTTPSTSSLDLGSCTGSSPFIVFGPGFDGRNQDSFEPADEATFNHGSALNIGVIADFICQRLVSPCNAPQSTIDACNAGTQAATATGVTGQAAADAFNSALA